MPTTNERAKTPGFPEAAPLDFSSLGYCFPFVILSGAKDPAKKLPRSGTNHQCARSSAG